MKQSFRNLFVWQAGVDLAVHISNLADKLIERRKFALANQLERASLSVPSNIAEGQGRLTRRDRRHFYSQARGSVYEVETQLEVASRIVTIDAADLEVLRTHTAKIGAGLTKMIDSLA